MATGKWVTIEWGPKNQPGFNSCFCHQCDDYLLKGEPTFGTEKGTYCSEACADEAESHNSGLIDEYPTHPVADAELYPY